MNKPVFIAQTEISSAQPEKIFENLLSGYAEHYPVEHNDNKATIALQMGIAKLTLEQGHLAIVTEAKNESDLSYLKFAVAEGIIHHAAGEALDFRWEGDGAGEGSLPPFFREMTVISVRNVTPHMRRIRLRGNDLARYATGGLHVRLILPPKPPLKPQWPHLGADGRPVWPDGEQKLINRVYTIRNINVEENWVDIDMVVHPSTDTAPGTEWAMQAQIGDIIGMNGPGGGDAGEADIYILIGDETALPAISRILERLPATAMATVRIEVADEVEEQVLETAAMLDLEWLHRIGAEAGTTSLLIDAVRDAAPMPIDGRRIFAWAGCEFDAFKAIRAFWRKECGLSRDDHMAVAYWRRGVAGRD